MIELKLSKVFKVNAIIEYLKTYNSIYEWSELENLKTYYIINNLNRYQNSLVVELIVTFWCFKDIKDLNLLSSYNYQYIYN